MATDSFRFHSILVPLDGSAFSEHALPLAARIADRTGGRLRLALVHELPPAPLDPIAAKMFTSMELATRRAERSYLRSIQARLREGGTRPSSAVTMSGTPGPTLRQYAEELGMDMVVMATHGRGGVRRAWLGSVADYLIRNLKIPVLLVRPREGVEEPKRASAPSELLLPLDGSPLAEEAIPLAVHLARALNLDISLIQVVSPVPTSSDAVLPVPSPYDEDITAMVRDQAQDYLDSLAQRLRDGGLRATAAATIGWNTADAILELARPERVGLMVTATHGRGGLQRLILGSVADKLVRGADVPVLVYRPADRPKSKKPADREQSRKRSSAKAGR
jgi:nucleotide-binding universal stress UspA family protein